ncbi:MAG: 50S ribosomal protein L10 [Candidatus Izemoplasmatales bacterium]
MSREQTINVKQEEVNALVGRMKDAKAIVVAEYRGLTVLKTEELRRLLRKEDCELIVAKNNISRRAAQICGFGALDHDLNGPNGIVVSRKDPVIGAKILNDFTRKNVKLVIKSGVVDGDYYGPAEIKMIATLPPKPVLLAMLASQLYAPLSELAAGLDELANKK